jgi:hypothetical protein
MCLRVRVQGGFANRFRAIASASLWAEDLNKNLVVYWPVERGHMPCSLSELLEQKSIPRLAEVIDSYFPDGQPKKQITKPEEMKEEYEWIESYSEFHTDILNKTSRGICTLRQIRIRPEIEAVAESMFYKMGCKTSMPAVHIRRTDHKKCIQKSPLEAFQKAIANQTNDKFYLATDEHEVKDMFRDYFGGSMITGCNDFYGRIEKEQQVYGVIEWCLLHKFHTILASDGSSYSEIAAARAGATLKKVTREQ